MSIVSIHEEDKSNYLCKRFASLAASYLEHPSADLSPSAHIPLENLFRVLEMFRTDTFSDERPRGVLALEEPNRLPLIPTTGEPWHVEIKSAVHRSIIAAFGQQTAEAEAISELQGTLRQLAQSGGIQPGNAAATRAKTFFDQLSVAL